MFPPFSVYREWRDKIITIIKKIKNKKKHLNELVTICTIVLKQCCLPIHPVSTPLQTNQKNHIAVSLLLWAEDQILPSP